jgi:hypothetical protein
MNVVCFVLVALASLLHPVDSVPVVGAPEIRSLADARNLGSARRLRVETLETQDDEDRGLNLEKVKTLLVPVTQGKLDKWAKAGKPVKDVFTRLELATSPSRLLFDNPQFVSWVKSVIPTLTARYGDETLAKMIAAATRNTGTKDLATRLNAAQVQHWAKTGKSPSDVYTLFNLDKVKKGILSNPQFSAWTKYVDDFNVKNPDEATTAIPTLTAHYGDDVLFEMLNMAKAVEETKSIATKLQTEQLRAGYPLGSLRITPLSRWDSVRRTTFWRSRC